MQKKSALMFATLACISLTTIPLAGCQLPNINDDTSDTTQQTKQTQQLKTLAQQKQQLSEHLWQLQNQKVMAVNKNNLKQLTNLKQPLFDTANQLTKVTNEMVMLNKVLRQRYHHAVLDDGTVINTGTLLKTDDSLSNHQRAHLLINKMKKLQKQQQTITEKLWDDQNQITIAIKQNNAKKLKQLQQTYFTDRINALPILNKIDMLSVQIAKFTQDLNKPTVNVHSNQTYNDWVIWQLMAHNNNTLNNTVTPSNPNDEIMTERINNEEETNANPEVDEAHSNTGTSDEGHPSETTGHTTTGEEGHTTGGDTGGEGHAGGGEAAGGHGGE